MIDLNNYHANYVAVNNGRLYYEIAGNGDPLVFVPASILDRRIWDDQFHYFSQTHTVLRYDMRGFGKSETLPGTYAYHEDLYKLLQALQFKSSVVIGVSSGGAVALEFTLEHSEMVRGLVLTSSALGGNPSRTSVTAAKASAKFFQKGDLSQTLESILRLRVDGPTRSADAINPRVREKIRSILSENLTSKSTQYTVPQLLNPPAVTRLHELSLPTCVIVGDQDIEDVKTSSSIITEKTANAENYLLEGLGHMLHMEQPAYYNQLLLHFLQSIGINGHSL